VSIITVLGKDDFMLTLLEERREGGEKEGRHIGSG
jgi:hypothetical protein